jgi:hypothetical protein
MTICINYTPRLRVATIFTHTVTADLIGWTTLTVTADLIGWTICILYTSTTITTDFNNIRVIARITFIPNSIV